MRESLSGRNLGRLEVVVPQDMAVGMLNARHKELTELEDRHDWRRFSGRAVGLVDNVVDHTEVLDRVDIRGQRRIKTEAILASSARQRVIA